MRPAGGEPLQHILPSQGGFGRGPVADAGDRPAVPGDPLLWVAADEGLAGAAGYTGEPEAGAAADAGHGAAGHLPATRTSRPAPGVRVYPYLLGKAEITRPNQVWAADITYLPMARGFLYLVAVMDWHSRYVLSWRLSNTLEAGFCAEALTEALDRGRPEVFNTDQGSQFTSQEFTQVLQDRGVKISMDGKGRYADNIFVERLWRTVKYEEVYLKAYASAGEARRELGAYFRSTMTRGPIRPWGIGRRGKCSLRAGRPKMKSQQLGGGRRKQTWYLMRERRDPHLTPP